MNPTIDAAMTAQQLWEQTLRREYSGPLTPATSLTMGRACTDTALAQRVRAVVRARAEFADRVDNTHYDYLLGELIGAGGMGLVYAATQVALERTVAVKVLRAELDNNDAIRREFLAEALVAADLEHPNNVPIYDLGLTSQGFLFYSMKLVRGTKWSTALPEQSIDNNLDILLKVCDAVTFAHDKCVLHRDLKPDNVMVGAYGEVLLMDWGVAASVGSPRAQRLCDDNLFAGTPAYMAPEVAGCIVGQIGKASDIYLLGGILYKIVTGLAPHRGEDVMACLGAAMRNELQPTDASGELLAIALRALRTEPGERHASVKDFSNDVRSYLTHLVSLTFSAQASQRFETLLTLPQADFYRECDEIIALYQRALASWAGNTAAAERLIRLREILAGVALRRGEIQLAQSQVRAAEQERQLHSVVTLRPDSIAEEIKAALTGRERRIWK